MTIKEYIKTLFNFTPTSEIDSNNIMDKSCVNISNEDFNTGNYH